MPVGETLPEEKLVLQINFEGIELEGYPNKGIFQLFAREDADSVLGDEGINEEFSGDEYFYYGHEESCGAIGRYYADISDDYQKDITPSKHRLNGSERKANKLLLERAWTVPYLLLDDDYELNICIECDVFNKMKESEDLLGAFEEIINELFPSQSSIGSYWKSPQSMGGSPKETLLFLGEDLIDWGDSGAFSFTYKDITSMEKDEEIESYGDMC